MPILCVFLFRDQRIQIMLPRDAAQPRHERALMQLETLLRLRAGELPAAVSALVPRE